MDRREIRDAYFMEMGKCIHYEQKCHKYRDVDEEKYNKYYEKYLSHKRKASDYHAMMQENPVYSDGHHESSVCIDSSYFRESSSSSE